MKLGSCTIIRKLAQGGVADIYLAKAKDAKKSDKYLVCKCIRQGLTEDASFLTAVLNEVQFCVRLRHPNILEVFDLCLAESDVFLTMEYLDAQDLGRLNKACHERNERIPPRIALYITAQVARGLHKAHELKDESGNPLGLVHRDVSPENILFGSNGDIKIADFGIAKTAKMQENMPDDIIEGKINYMSPEQAWGDKLDRRADIFSLAVVMYETMLDVSFYPENSEQETIQCARTAVFKKPHEIDPEFPKDVEDILLKALDIDKKQRYQTMDEFRMDIERCLDSHNWEISEEQWIAWLRVRIPFPSPKLPLMRSSAYMPDETSLLKPASESSENAALPSIPDIAITAQFNYASMMELVRRSMSFSQLPAITVPKMEPEETQPDILAQDLAKKMNEVSSSDNDAIVEPTKPLIVSSETAMSKSSFNRIIIILCICAAFFGILFFVVMWLVLWSV